MCPLYNTAPQLYNLPLYWYGIPKTINVLMFFVSHLILSNAFIDEEIRVL